MTRRIDRVPVFRAVEMLEQARSLELAGHDVIHLEVGEPDFPTPEPIVAAGIQALRDGHTRYTPALGTDALRKAISDYYGNQLGLSIAPGRIVITAGASAGLLLAITWLCDPGESLLLPDPGYPCNAVFARTVGAQPLALPTAVEDRWQPQPAAVASHWQSTTRGLLVASPSNPIGSSLSAAALTALLEVVRERGGRLLLDEIYQSLMLREPDYASGLAVADDLVSINSFSKYFGMTGWRLGWLVLPEDMLPGMERLAQNLFISPSAPAQQAALAAFHPETIELCEQRRLELVLRQQRLAAGLRQLGFGLPVMPDGAFYLFADIEPLGLGLSGVDFCRRMIEEARVALTPGIDFGSNGTETMVRFACTTSVDRIDEALLRMARVLSG